MYKIIYDPPAKTYFKKLKDKNLKKLFKDAIIEISKDPSIGDTKKGDLLGIYGYDIHYKKTNYEIAYTIEELSDGSFVIIIMAGTRENFWDEVKKYIKS